jgi:hypothetical protein
MENKPDMKDPDVDAYGLQASAHCKVAIFIWCIAGWAYALITWHVFWIPGLLIFFPGILVASIIAAVFFIPLWIVMNKARADWQKYGSKRWSLLVAGTILKVGVYLGPLSGALLYVNLLRAIMK